MSDDLILAALARLEAGQGRIESRQTIVDERLTRLDERLTRLEEHLTRLEEHQTRLEEGQTRLRVDSMERMDRLENNLTVIRDDIGVNMGAVEHVRNAEKNMREDLHGLHDTLAILHRKVMRLEGQVREIRGEP